jgi:hypothetical protein
MSDTFGQVCVKVLSPYAVGVSCTTQSLRWVITLAPLRTVEIQQSIIDIAACGLVRTVDTADVDVLCPDVGARLGTRADDMSDERRKDSVSPAANVLEGDVGDVEACLSIYVSNMIQ